MQRLFLSFVLLPFFLLAQLEPIHAGDGGGSSFRRTRVIVISCVALISVGAVATAKLSQNSQQHSELMRGWAFRVRSRADRHALALIFAKAMRKKFRDLMPQSFGQPTTVEEKLEHFVLSDFVVQTLLQMIDPATGQIDDNEFARRINITDMGADGSITGIIKLQYGVGKFLIFPRETGEIEFKIYDIVSNQVIFESVFAAAQPNAESTASSP